MATIDSGWRKEWLALRLLAWPLVIGNLGTVAIQVTDTMMLARLGPTPLAAVGLAAHLSLVVSLLCTGTVEAVAPLVAQARGRHAADRSAISSVVRHGIVTGLLLCGPLCLLLWDSSWIFHATGQEAIVAEIGSGYLQIFLFAIPAMVLATALRGYVVGMEMSRLVLPVSIATVVVNFLGNWVLIFGNLGAPALGARGAALSSVFASGFAVLLFLILIRRSTTLSVVPLLKGTWRMTGSGLWEVARLGVPIGLILLVEIAFFTTAAVLAGTFGVEQLAAHQVAVQVVGVTLMLPVAIGQAATVRVGLSYGRQDLAGLRAASRVPLLATVLVMALLSALLWIFAPLLVKLFLGPDAPSAHPDTFQYSVLFLKVAAVFQLVDGLQAASAGVLRGLGDTVVPLVLASASYWGVGIPLAHYISGSLGMEAFGVWVGMASALACCAIGMLGRTVWAVRQA